MNFKTQKTDGLADISWPVFKPSDFTIINADRKFEFDREYDLSMSDQQGRKLGLKLNYVYVVIMT